MQPHAPLRSSASITGIAESPVPKSSTRRGRASGCHGSIQGDAAAASRSSDRRSMTAPEAGRGDRRAEHQRRILHGRHRPQGSPRRPRCAARDRRAETGTIPRAHAERTVVATRRRWSTRWLERLRRGEPSARRRPTDRGRPRPPPDAPSSTRSSAATSGAAARPGRRAASRTPHREPPRLRRTGSVARPPPIGACGRRAALPCPPSGRAPTGTRSSPAFSCRCSTRSASCDRTCLGRLRHRSSAPSASSATGAGSPATSRAERRAVAVSRSSAPSASASRTVRDAVTQMQLLLPDGVPEALRDRTDVDAPVVDAA